jgi:hypothetical protein
MIQDVREGGLSGLARQAGAVALASGVLLALASQYDFFCDDAFITLRYAQNLATYGAPVYNPPSYDPAERVEGYTSFTWLLLAALGAKLPVALTGFVQVLGALSGVGLLAASAALLHRALDGQHAVRAIALLAIAATAPIAAWTMGGLETPLFAALTTGALALALDVHGAPSLKRGAVLGAVLGLATLTRPEGALVAGVVLLVLAAALIRSREGRLAIITAGAVAALIVGTHLAWRVSYYGYPLPNTFYLKSSGDPALLRARGLSYVAFAARELGYGLITAIALGLVAPQASAPARLLAWIARLLVPLYVVYVIMVGGDFLDMYRFFVPLLPLGMVLVACALSAQLARFSQGNVLLATVVTLLVLHGAHQHALASRARQVAEPERSSRGIEPLGWTRLYALRWAAMGRWIGAHATQSDRMAVGAAGAMPYFAGIHNLDTFGLCDAWVSHHAPVVGNRPGHQRFAPRSYILRHKPAFLLIGNDYTRDKPEPLRRDLTWKRLGYVWAEAKVDQATFGAPKTFFHYFLMRADRAEQNASSKWLRASTGDDR